MNLGGCHGNHSNTGGQNSLKFMLLSSLGSINRNDLKFMSFWAFKGLLLLLVVNGY